VVKALQTNLFPPCAHVASDGEGGGVEDASFCPLQMGPCCLFVTCAAGPQEDIVVEVAGEDGRPTPTGFLAATAAQFADAMVQVSVARQRRCHPHLANVGALTVKR
jgi:hypothetical protein